jgi:rubrerythrin
MLDLPRLLDKSERLQWSVDDVDWDAPGAERVSDAQADALAAFMGDLYWIESTAAVVFEAMAERDDDPVRKGLFRSFAIDEARHAEAERRLMVRWGIVGRRQRPEPNANVRHLYETLQVHATEVHPSVFSAIIPMTELVLDGALVKYLVQVVDDPICHRVFEGINADEARHLAMDFHMLEHYGREQSRFTNTMDLLRSVLNPAGLYATFFGYFPMLARSRGSLEKIGLDMDEAARAMGRYVELGRKNPDIAKHPTYRILSRYVEGVTSGRSRIGDVLVRVSDVVDGLSAAGRAA